MPHLIMPEGTAVWLIDNTTLTFEQIAAFCDLNYYQVKAIADGDVAKNLKAENPITREFLTQEEIDKGQQDPKYVLKMLQGKDLPTIQKRTKGARYTPINKRADKPNGIAYLVKNYPDFTDPMIVKLLGTTKKTVQSIRDRTNPNMANITPTDPVELGLCKRLDIDALIKKVELKKQKDAKKASKQTA